MHLLLTSENLMKSFLREERFRLDIGANINGKNAEIHSSVQRPRTTEAYSFTFISTTYTRMQELIVTNY